MTLTVTPIKSEKKSRKFDLFEEICISLSNNKISLQSGDVLVISSKFVSQSQGRIINYDSTVVSDDAKHIAKEFQITPKFSEVIVRESDRIFGGVSGFTITSSDNILAPNAGIDKSNSYGTKLILYPNKPYLIAEQIKRKLFLKFLIHVGIIIVDSRLMPGRVGTIGIAIACSGIEPVTDLRGKKDLDGNPLKVTFQALADNLASIANHSMGEGAESQPIAIVRNSTARLTDRKIDHNEMTVSEEQCLYIRGFKTEK